MSNPTSIPIRSSIDWKLIVERCSDDAVEEDQQASEEAMRTIASSGTRSGGGQHKRKAEKIRVEKIDHKLFCGGCRGKVSAFTIVSKRLHLLLSYHCLYFWL